ncbi:lysophospholipid acyltransferase family protein [Cytophagaceae bacterium ABcell3]|nr:lysophospholipid acyltransferase family protein [Cytophagaceae bacterium ABcell3]
MFCQHRSYMKQLFARLAIGVIYTLSLLPLSTLYGISNCLYLVAYRGIGYRKKVVRENLRNSFPEKSSKELLDLEKNFYRYLCDLIVEIIKKFTISKEEGYKRCSFKDSTVVDELASKQQNIIGITGHIGNWEWGDICLGNHIKHKAYAIYKPLSTKVIDRLMHKQRRRFNVELIAMNDTYRRVISNKNHLNVTFFIADQTPSPQGAYWTTFLNQDTPVFRGPARIAKKMNYPMVYVSVKRKARGYYQLENELLVKNPTNHTEEELCEIYIRRIEKDIIENPETWLWSHRRWKHSRPKT